jgi:hypothetical protein
MRKGVLAAAGLALLAAFGSAPAQAMAIPAPASSERSTPSADGTVGCRAVWRCGYYGCGWRRVWGAGAYYHRPYSYYRPYRHYGPPLVLWTAAILRTAAYYGYYGPRVITGPMARTGAIGPTSPRPRFYVGPSVFWY